MLQRIKDAQETIQCVEAICGTNDLMMLAGKTNLIKASLKLDLKKN